MGNLNKRQLSAPARASRRRLDCKRIQSDETCYVGAKDKNIPLTATGKKDGEVTWTDHRVVSNVVAGGNDPALATGDRRRFRRYPLDTTLTYRLLFVRADGRIFSGRTLNMGRGGLLFTTHVNPSVLEIGDCIEVQLDWPTDTRLRERAFVCLCGTIARQDVNLVALAIHRFQFRDHPTM